MRPSAGTLTAAFHRQQGNQRAPARKLAGRPSDFERWIADSHMGGALPERIGEGKYSAYQ